MMDLDLELTLNLDFAKRYYRLALSRAVRRDLGGAIRLARYACILDEKHENAAKLLALCLYESAGEPGAGPGSDEIEQIRAAAQQKKWRKAIRLANALPHRSVRVINTQGCLYACAKRYGKAARAFAEALDKDSANELAAASLAEIAKRRRGFRREHD